MVHIAPGTTTTNMIAIISMSLLISSVLVQSSPVSVGDKVSEMHLKINMLTEKMNLKEILSFEI
jgi:hypothetical protein